MSEKAHWGQVVLLLSDEEAALLRDKLEGDERDLAKGIRERILAGLGSDGSENIYRHHAQHNRGTCVISYGGFEALAPRSEIERILGALRKSSKRARSDRLHRVTDFLSKHWPLKGDEDQETITRTCEAVAIWFANEVIEGRTSIDPH